MNPNMIINKLPININITEKEQEISTMNSCPVMPVLPRLPCKRLPLLVTLLDNQGILYSICSRTASSCSLITTILSTGKSDMAASPGAIFNTRKLSYEISHRKVMPSIRTTIDRPNPDMDQSTSIRRSLVIKYNSYAKVTQILTFYGM